MPENSKTNVGATCVSPACVRAGISGEHSSPLRCLAVNKRCRGRCPHRPISLLLPSSPAAKPPPSEREALACVDATPPVLSLQLSSGTMWASSPTLYNHAPHQSPGVNPKRGAPRQNNIIRSIAAASHANSPGDYSPFIPLALYQKTTPAEHSAGVVSHYSYWEAFSSS